MIKTILNSETKKLMYKESIKRLSYTENTIPMISVYYYEPKQTINDTIIIPMYFTDYYQREHYYNDNSLRFKLRYELDGEINYIENLTASFIMIIFTSVIMTIIYSIIQKRSKN